MVSLLKFAFLFIISEVGLALFEDKNQKCIKYEQSIAMNFLHINFKVVEDTYLKS